MTDTPNYSVRVRAQSAMSGQQSGHRPKAEGGPTYQARMASAAGRAVPEAKKLASAAPSAPAPASSVRPPVFATTTVKQTPQGPEYTVAWTDTVRLRFWDRFHVWPTLAALSCSSTGVGAFYQFTVYEHVGGLNPFAKLAVILVLLAVGGLVAIKLYEAPRQSRRSIVFSADGAIRFENPPSPGAHGPTDNPGIVIGDGLARLGSIECTRTSEWVMLMKERAHLPEHWWDVHLFFGDEWRVSVSRNMGSRDHAHQLAAHLNKLKAELMRPKPVPATTRATQAID